jgi:gamma-glutamyl hydrolase
MGPQRAVELLLVATFVSCARCDDRPVIGILTQPTDEALRPLGEAYLVASYVKWIESAGARVAPVHFNSTEAELTTTWRSLSGLVFPGGGSGIHGTAFANASWYLMQLAQRANDAGDVFPVWGTCQGFQQLVQFGSGAMEPSVIKPTAGACFASRVLQALVLTLPTPTTGHITYFPWSATLAGTEGLIVPVNFTRAGRASQLMSPAPTGVLHALSTQPVTINLHHYGAHAATVEQAGSALHAFFEVVATNVDGAGTEFVSLVQSRAYPFYGAQFHPEKNAFEWDQSWEQNRSATVAHSAAGARASQYFADFFVGEARRSPHVWPAAAADAPTPLIYAYQTVRTATQSNKWEQCYVFP